MAVNMKGKGRQSTTIQREREGSDVFVRALRDGSLVGIDWLDAAVIAGYCYHVTMGDETLSTGLVGGGNGTAMDLDEPELVLTIPNGTSIRPTRLAVQVQSGAPSDAQEVEILIAVDQDKALDATSIAGSTMTTKTIYNMNTLSGSTSACGCYTAFTDTITDPVLDIVLARKVIEFEVIGSAGILTAEYGLAVDLVYEPLRPPIINGPAQLIIYWGGDAATIGGFAQIEWMERSESDFTL